VAENGETRYEVTSCKKSNVTEKQTGDIEVLACQILSHSENMQSIDMLSIFNLNKLKRNIMILVVVFPEYFEN